MDKYEQNKIKEYQYWTVYVHENQSYLGRCVIACKRSEADDLANATFEGVVFKDELWGHNYKTDHNFQTTDEIREKIKQTIQKMLDSGR